MDYPDTAFELDQVECERTFFKDTCLPDAKFLIQGRFTPKV